MKKCLLIAPLVSHATLGRIAALGCGNYDLYVADISTRPMRHDMSRYPYSLIKSVFSLEVTETDPFYRKSASLSEWIIDSLRSRGLLPEYANLINRIREVISSIEPDVIVVYYGATAIHFARMVRRIFPKIPIVLIFNVLPITLERKRGWKRFIRRAFINEFVDYKRWANSIDVFICASDEMADFATRRLQIPTNKLVVLPDYLSQCVNVKTLNRVQKSQESQPRVIFLGAPERWGPTIDNLDTQFMELAAEGVTVYSGAMSNLAIETGYCFKYPYFTDDEVFEGKLANYAHSFDAAIITYGIKERRERFRSTLPTRFLTALTAAVPIAVRAGIFDAVESYVTRHGLGFVYESPKELREALADHQAMDSYRRNVIEHLQEIASEKQAPQFETIFESIVR